MKNLLSLSRVRYLLCVCIVWITCLHGNSSFAQADMAARRQMENQLTAQIASYEQQLRANPNATFIRQQLDAAKTALRNLRNAGGGGGTGGGGGATGTIADDDLTPSSAGGRTGTLADDDVGRGRAGGRTGTLADDDVAHGSAGGRTGTIADDDDIEQARRQLAGQQAALQNLLNATSSSGGSGNAGGSSGTNGPTSIGVSGGRTGTIADEEPPPQKPAPKVLPDPNNPWSFAGSWSYDEKGKPQYWERRRGEDGKYRYVQIIPTVHSDGSVSYTDAKPDVKKK